MKRFPSPGLFVATNLAIRDEATTLRHDDGVRELAHKDESDNKHELESPPYFMLLLEVIAWEDNPSLEKSPLVLIQASSKSAVLNLLP